jgi:5-methylcytosine-specific restriction endonuclease McrA
MMFNEVRSYSKADQLKGHQKQKDKPKYKEKRPKKKPKVNKNIEMFRGRRIPHWKKRGEVPRKEANKTLRFYGEQCFYCGNPQYSLHHVMHKGFGIGGRGVWTNLIPLCEKHHTGDLGPHKNPSTVDKELKERHEKLFGPHYYKDRWDLWMEGLIENPTDELYQRFMEREREHAAGNRTQKPE